MRCIYLAIGVLLLLTSCNKEKLVTYVVKGNTLAYISYTDEFGNMVNEPKVGKRIVGPLHEVNWTKEFRYHPNRFSNSHKLVLDASPYKDELCNFSAEIYVDNKKVADSSYSIIAKQEMPFIRLEHRIKH